MLLVTTLFLILLFPCMILKVVSWKSRTLSLSLIPKVVMCYYHYLQTGIAIGKYCISHYCERKNKILTSKEEHTKNTSYLVS